MTLAGSEWVILWLSLLSICSTAILLLTMCSCPRWKALQRSETRLQFSGRQLDPWTRAVNSGSGNRPLHDANVVPTRCKSRGNTHALMRCNCYSRIATTKTMSTTYRNRRHQRLNRIPQIPARCACGNHAPAWRWSLVDTRASVCHVQTPLPT